MPTINDREIFAFEKSGAELTRATVAGSTATLVVQLLRMLMQFGMQLILARILFPTDFGLLAMVAPLIGFLQIVNDIGFGQLIVQRKHIYQQQVSNLFWANFGLSIGLTLLLISTSPLVASLYNEPEIVQLTVVLAIMIPISTVGIYPSAMLSRSFRFITVAKIEIVTAVIGNVLTILLALYFMNYWALAASQLCTTILHVSVTWASAGWRPSRPRRNSPIREDFLFGGNVTGTNVANFLSSSGDNILIGTVAGPTALGLYDRSYRLVVQPIGQLLLPLSRVATPFLSRLISNDVEYRRVYISMVQLILLATAPGLTVCIMDGQDVILFLLGDRWILAAQPFSWICVGGLASGLYTSATWLYVSQNRASEMFRFMSAAAIINVVSFAVGVNWGVVGVAAVSGLSFLLIQMPLVMYGATRQGPVDRLDVLRPVVVVLLSCFVASCVIIARPELEGEIPAISIFINTMAAYTINLLAVGLTADGRHLIRRGRQLFGNMA